MATININPPAKISRNTAADGDFLWKQDFEVLYNNDIALKNAIEQGAKELTPSSGINIDADKNITVNKGKGLKFNGNALEVDIKGKGGADVTFEGDKIVVSAYDPSNLIQEVNELDTEVGVVEHSLEDYQDYVAGHYVPKSNQMQEGTQYVYSTSGWVPIAGGSQQEISYWRPSYNSSTGKIEWEMRPSPSMVTPDPSDDLRGANGDNGKTPKFQINQSTNFWEWKYVEDPETTPWTSTNTSATGPRGATGETGPQGFSIELDHVDTVPGGKEITLKWGDPASPSTSAFIIPSGDKGGKGDQGDKGDSGDNGYTPSVSADDITDVNGRGKKVTFYWPEGPAGKSDTEFNIYHGYSPTMALRAVTDPQGLHTEGGIEFTINYLDKGTSAIGTIWNGNNGEDGSNSVYTRGPYLSGHGGDSTIDPVGLTDKAIEAIEAVSGKVNKPDTSFKNMYLALRTNNDGTVSGWTNILDKVYSRSSSDNRYMQKHRDYTLSGDGATDSPLGIDTKVLDANKQYAFTTNGWDEIDDFVKKTGDTMTGALTVKVATGQNILAVASAASLVGASRQSEANFGQNNNAMGTTWMGVGGPGMYRGFLKYTQGGNVGDLDSNNTMQVEFTPNNKGTIFAKARNSGNDCPETQILNPTKASCDTMVQSANANLVSGPNYMLAKNADGQFVIGAALVNCTDINNVTLAPNTYYFVYEV